MPPKSQLAVYLTEEQLKAIKEWAASENRKASNLAATIILKALEEYQRNKGVAELKDE